MRRAYLHTAISSHLPIPPIPPFTLAARNFLPAVLTSEFVVLRSARLSDNLSAVAAVVSHFCRPPFSLPLLSLKKIQFRPKKRPLVLGAFVTSRGGSWQISASRLRPRKPQPSSASVGQPPADPRARNARTHARPGH